jgi:hypothetical protein
VAGDLGRNLRRRARRIQMVAKTAAESVPHDLVTCDNPSAILAGVSI